MKIYNHIAPRFSEIEWQMVKSLPEGGNWQNIPTSVPSKRLEQIRASGGRTTLYGRLRKNAPSYTISTYFNRMGNGCFVHPTQDRLISIREGARLQSFPDDFVFKGSRTSQFKQIGNAVPPILAYHIANLIKPHVSSRNFIDLFAGAGGMSVGFKNAGFNLIGAVEIEKNYFETFKENHKEASPESLILGDITHTKIKQQLIDSVKDLDVGIIIGGPPCQGFSHAGWRDPKDPRNQLFREFVSLVKDIHPDCFIMENVPGILTMRKGDAVKEIIAEFKSIGYNVQEPILLKAEEFGVPQKRRRVFIIGSKKDINLEKPKSLFSNEDNSLPKPITVQEAIGNLPSLNAGEGQTESDIKTTAYSKYEELIAGKINFEEFYKSKKKNQ